MLRIPRLKWLRWSALILGISNVALIVLGLIVVAVVRSACGKGYIAPFLLIASLSCLRIAVMIRIGFAQRSTALMIVNSQADVETQVTDAAIRHQRRERYRRWLCWTRVAALLTALQFVQAGYITLIVTRFVYHDGTSSNCVLGHLSSGIKWQQNALIVFMVIVCYVGPTQCFTGSDVLRWRSFYAREDTIWKAHYREVFDHGIRETLCCLGRAKYLAVLEEDEVSSVAQLLGDLVTYRASGKGHLELLAGLALMQRYSSSLKVHEELSDVPEDRIHEATVFHPFAEAAYTGVLLDLGRNPMLFSCVWLYRQGVFTPWSRSRWPAVEGDNWWRGHAAAFLKYVNLPPEILRKGRVEQDKCKAAYFVVVLHHLRSVVVAVRGTETPEDLITDGLGRECSLTAEDLSSLVNCNDIQSDMRQSFDSLRHYGHSGVVEAARELYIQVEGDPTGGGLLSSLLGAGRECDSYKLRIVGHSLGGAIAALLGVRLYHQYPNLHVYTYGSLPCLDFAAADACSEFITSIVYGDEFSARLSVASIMRLRAAAIKALSQDATIDPSVVFKFARHFKLLCNCQQIHTDNKFPELSPMATTAEDVKLHVSQKQCDNGSHIQYPEFSLWQDVNMEGSNNDDNESSDSRNLFSNACDDSAADVYRVDNSLSQFMEVASSSENKSFLDIPEMFIPGLIIHIVPQKGNPAETLWRRWSWYRTCSYRAYVAKREAFKDVIVSPSMFLDHLPWRCQNAMNKILQMQNSHTATGGSQIV